MKLCKKCNTEKDETEFYWENKALGKRKYACIACLNPNRQYQHGVRTFIDTPELKRSRHLKHKFGIDLDDYNKMLAEQDGKCKICGTTDPQTPKNNFCVDHCHKTGKIRGLLCSHCNKGLGHFLDDVAKLQQAISYLQNG